MKTKHLAAVKRWQIPIDERTALAGFRTRVLTVVDQHAGRYLLQHPAAVNRFAYLMGIPSPTTASVGLNFQTLANEYVPFASTLIYKVLQMAQTMDVLGFAIQSLFTALEDGDYSDTPALASALRAAIEISPGIPWSISRRENHVTLFPSGAKLLDEAVIEDTLAWLEGYPTVAKYFEEALRIYESKDTKKYRNLLDNLRVAIEQLLRGLLENKRSLENQKEDLLRWLSKHGAHDQVQKMYNALVFGHFAQYQNDAVKHGEKWNKSEVEFMIYLTGTFMRFLLSLQEAGEQSG